MPYIFQLQHCHVRLIYLNVPLTNNVARLIIALIDLFKVTLHSFGGLPCAKWHERKHPNLLPNIYYL